MDRLPPQRRSWLMSRVKGRDTGPERHVRRILSAMGLRYRLHRRDLPGTPDIVLPGRGAVIFVHGCFWHAHDCAKGRAPKSRRRFWDEKRVGNRRRDARHRRELRKLGYRVMTIWQCRLKSPLTVERRIKAFLGLTERPLRS